MEYLILAILFVCAICKAIMDTCAHHGGGALVNLSDSQKWKEWFNYDGLSWLNKYIDRDSKNGLRTISVLGITLPYPVQLTDAWHFFGTIQIFCIALLFAIGANYIRPLSNGIVWYFAGSGLLYNTIFSLFYDHFLTIKTKK
jgi:hypothetical protein